MLYRHQKKNDEPRDMVRILSEMEKCTSNINLTDDHLITEMIIEKGTLVIIKQKNLLFKLVKK